MEPSKEKPAPNPAQRAAANSAQLTLVVLLVLMLGRRLQMSVLMDLVALLIIIAALGAGVFALAATRKYGREGVLRPALLGVTIHSLFLLIFIANFTAAREAARARQDRDAGYEIRTIGGEDPGVLITPPGPR